MSDIPGKPSEVVSPSNAIPVLRIHQLFPIGSQGAQMVFETYCAQDANVIHINRIVDKMEAVASRQLMKGQLAAKKVQLDQAILQQNNMKRDIKTIEEEYRRKQQNDIERGRRNPAPLSEKEQMNKRTVETSMEANEATIVRLKYEITDLMKVIEEGVEERAAAE